MTEKDDLPFVGLKKLVNSSKTINFSLSPMSAWVVFVQLQIAQRHSANTGLSSEAARKFALTIQETLAKIAPELKEVMEQGWHAEFDVPAPNGEDK